MTLEQEINAAIAILHRNEVEGLSFGQTIYALRRILEKERNGTYSPYGDE